MSPTLAFCDDVTHLIHFWGRCIYIHVCVYIYIHIYMCVYIYIYMYVYIHICMYIYICAYIYPLVGNVQIHTNMCIYIYKYVYIYTYVYTHICMYIHICTYIYIYTYTYSPKSALCSLYIVNLVASEKKKNTQCRLSGLSFALRVPNTLICSRVSRSIQYYPPQKKIAPPRQGKKKHSSTVHEHDCIHSCRLWFVLRFFFWRESRSIFQSKCCLCVALFSVCMCPSLLGNHNCCGTQDTYIDRTRIYYVSICVLRIFYVYICVLCIYVFSHLYSVYSSSSQDTNISTIYVIWGGYN